MIYVDTISIMQFTSLVSFQIISMHLYSVHVMAILPPNERYQWWYTITSHHRSRAVHDNSPCSPRRQSHLKRQPSWTVHLYWFTFEIMRMRSAIWRQHQQRTRSWWLSSTSMDVSKSVAGRDVTLQWRILMYTSLVGISRWCNDDEMRHLQYFWRN